MNQRPGRRRNAVRTFEAALSARRLPFYLAVSALVLTLPALGIGWQLDDHFQRMVMLGKAEGQLAPMAAFSVLDGDSGVTNAFRDLGYVPWWTPEDFRLAFFRPLALATTWLDYQLWPNSAALMHAHSLLWFAALVSATALLYRRLLEPTWVAGLAAVLYALDDAHSSPAAWLANRNALLATLFGVLCLVAHDRWRRDGWRPGAFLAPVLLALGLISGELALATTGYLFAHALFLDPLTRETANRTRRWRLWLPLLPHAFVIAAWACAYVSGGYGAAGSGLYLDPLRSPVPYARALLQRVPFLIMGQWTPLPAELGALLAPPGTRFWWLLAVAVVVALSAALLPLLRRDRVARFWGLGMVLSLLPSSATFPSNRLLMFVGLGAMGLLARFLETTWFEPSGASGLGPRLRRGLAWGLVFTHLALAPVLMLLGPAAIRELGEPMRDAAASLGSDPRLADQDLIVANAPDYLMYVTNLPTLQTLEGRPIPRRILALSTGPTPVALERIDERTLRVSLERGLFAGPLGRLFRGATHPLDPGHVVRSGGTEIEVLSQSAEGSPGTILYRFKKPLENSSMRWVRWNDGHFLDFEPPAPGQTISLPPAKGPLDRLGW